MVIEYIKSRLKYIILFIVFAGVYSVISFLYSLPFGAVSYSLLLCICIGIVVMICDGIKYCKYHTELSDMRNRIVLTLEGMPQPKGLIEKDYSQLCEILFDHKTDIQSQADLAKSNMIDYYTLWAHQIKTPIAAMRLLLQTEDTEYSQELSMELFKIEQYVEMVLQYMRLNSDTTDFVIQEYCLDNIVKQVLRKYAKQFIRKKLTLNYEPLDCYVLTDEKWLSFVIEQVLSNSIKYTSTGTISIYLQGKKTLVIEDTGMGIQQEDLPRVFDRGYTGYNGRADKKSTGIGLYLCRRILRKLSHTIRIESEVEKGTRVFIGLDNIDLEVE